MRAQSLIVGFLVAGLSAVAHAQRRVAWSPDGQQLIVPRESGDSAGLWIMRSDGSQPRRLYSSGKLDMYPSWSRDGKVVLFNTQADRKSDIFALDLATGTVSRITSGAYPTFSPDGRRVAYMSNGTGTWQLYVMRPDGSDVHQITSTKEHNFNPEWSPDGRRLVFESARDGRKTDDIYVIDADGSGEQRLTDPPTHAIFPAWSPDGKHITYQTSGSIILANADGSQPRTLVDRAGLGQWSPDGKRLAFIRAGKNIPDPGVYIYDVDRGTTTRVAP